MLKASSVARGITGHFGCALEDTNHEHACMGPSTLVMAGVVVGTGECSWWQAGSKTDIIGHPPKWSESL